MVTAKQFYSLMPGASEIESDEPEMESSQHYSQLALLVNCLEWHWQDRDDFFIGANLTVYYSRQQLRRRDFLGPDFFVVRETVRRHRYSWVVWEEDGRYPDLVIELLSPTTANVDRTTKKALYHNNFRTPEYFWFSPITLEFEGFRWTPEQYEPIEPDARGRRWSNVLELFLGVDGDQLRFFDPHGGRLPTSGEAAQQIQQEVEQAQQEVEQAQQEVEQAQQEVEQAQQEVEQAQQQAEQAQQQAERERSRSQRLAERLRALGIDPDEDEAAPL